MTEHTGQNRQQLLQCIEEAVSAEEKDGDRILSYLNECDQPGIEVLPLDINQSEMECALEHETVLRIGFSALVTTGSQCLVDILEERRKNGLFQSFQDFCERIEVETLPEGFLARSIEAGAFDSTGISRARLFAGYGKILKAVQKSKTNRSANQISLFDMMPAVSSEKMESIALPEVDPWTDEEMIDHEKQSLGFSYTAYLLQREEEAAEDIEPDDAGEEQPVQTPESEEKVVEEPVEETLPSPPEGVEAVVEESVEHIAAQVEPVSGVQEPSLATTSESEGDVASTVIIRLEAKNTTEKMLHQLRERLEQSRGGVQVILEFVDEQQTVSSVKAHADYKVSVSEKLVKDIEAIAGEQAVRVDTL